MRPCFFGHDTDYGNEKECGEGVARAIQEGLVTREELFITSKLWPVFEDGDKVEAACRRSLADWGLEYFDLYLIHFPGALKYVDPAERYPPGWQVGGESGGVVRSATPMHVTWAAMESLVQDTGLARSIGVSNFQAQLLYDVLRYARVRPAALQIEHHPYLVQADLVALARAEGIAVTAYSSFGPASFLEFGFPNAQAMVPLMQDPLVTSIAAKHGRKSSQVLLRWATQRGLAVIPKTSRKEVMAENLDVTGFDLDQADISDKDAGIRFNKPSNVGSPPFHVVHLPPYSFEPLAYYFLSRLAATHVRCLEMREVMC